MILNLRLLLTLLCCVLSVPEDVIARQSPAANGPTLAGPVTGGKGQAFGALSAPDLAASGFSEAEYVASGTSQAYDKAGAWGVDGKWSVTPVTRGSGSARSRLA